VNLAPKTVSIIRDGKEIEIDLEDVIVGDIIEIKPGGSIRSRWSYHRTEDQLLMKLV